MCLTLFFAKGSRCLGRNDKWPISTLTCKHEGRDYCLLPSTSWICLWGLMTTTLGLDLEPGISQRLGKVVIHWTSDGHRVGHRLCFFVVFSKAATEVLLNHRITDCVRYNDIMSEGRRKKTNPGYYHTCNLENTSVITPTSEYKLFCLWKKSLHGRTHLSRVCFNHYAS